jgi:hypothetical protein
MIDGWGERFRTSDLSVPTKDSAKRKFLSFMKLQPPKIFEALHPSSSRPVGYTSRDVNSGHKLARHFDNRQCIERSTILIRGQPLSTFAADKSSTILATYRSQLIVRMNRAR